MISVIIVNYFSARLVERAVDSVLAAPCDELEIFVVDNSCSADEMNRLRDVLPTQVRIINAGRNGGFGAGCNLGVERSQGDYLLFLNPDALVRDDALSRLREALNQRSDLGAVGPTILTGRGTVGHCGGRFVGLRRPFGIIRRWPLRCWQILRDRLGASPLPLREDQRPLQDESLCAIDYVTGAALMMRRQDFLALGGFDEDFFIYAEEMDLQYRLLHLRGLSAAVVRAAYVKHDEGGTQTGRPSQRRRALEAGCMLFVRKHHSLPYNTVYRALMFIALVLSLIADALETPDVETLRSSAQLLGLPLGISRWERS